MRKIVCLFFGIIFLAPLNAQNFDINTLKSINSTESAFKNGYAKFCSATTSPFSIASTVAILTTGLIKKDSKLKNDGFFMAGSLLANTIITQSLKHIIKRPRPFQTYSFIVKRTGGDDFTSMPSGHTSDAFQMATALSLRYKKWYVVAPSYFFASSVAWSRMYQGVHYPTDILFGVLIGSGCAWASYKLQQKITSKNKTKNQKVVVATF